MLMLRHRPFDQHCNREPMFVGKWYLIAVISDVKISDIPKCIVWNVEKEQNNIFNIRINEGMPSDEVRNLKRRFSNFPSGYLDLIDERSGSGEYVDYLNNFEAVLRRKDKVGYFLLSRTPKGVFKKLYHEYDIGAQENNWIYTTIDQMLGKWYVVGLVTSSSVHEFQNCMISHVTKINDGFEIKTTTRLATGEIGPTFYSQAMDDNSPGLVQSHGKSVGLNKLLDYLTPDYSEIVIKYPDNTFKYFLLSRNPARISPGLYYKYYDIARANNWRYLQFNNRNCD
ncbi:hypothetical protein PV327_010851 [Microctonus hyperodae]|uniref:Uncharacterized protein n=1 Tax=Microctonus hyperodae TaxID=165561 RepID=A0AA39C8C5_MICHY|nr:hypothetical protein PV327_010851 [Microctonus hyperodae]